MSNFLQCKNLIPSCQIGFTKNHRAADHILLLKAIVDSYKIKQKHVYACFIDFKAAFDSVWHDDLVYKMHKSGISNKIIKLRTQM